MASVLSFPTLPRSGSMLNGRVFQRQTLARRTRGSGFSFWPTADTNTSSYSNGERGENLREAAANWPMPKVGVHGEPGAGSRPTIASLWPTPDAAGGTGYNQTDSPGAIKRPLLGSAATLWQTPSVADTLGGHEKRGGKRGSELLLKGQTRMWALLCSRDVKGDDMPNRVGSPSLPAQAMRRAGESGLQRAVLNPSFVETLMGFPLGWTVCDASETQLSHSKPPLPSESSPGESVGSEVRA